MVSLALPAYTGRIEDTRRTACEGFLSRSFPRVYSQVPHFFSPAAELVADASGPGTVEGEVEEMSGDEQVVGGRKR